MEYERFRKMITEDWQFSSYDKHLINTSIRTLYKLSDGENLNEGQVRLYRTVYRQGIMLGEALQNSRSAHNLRKRLRLAQRAE